MELFVGRMMLPFQALLPLTSRRAPPLLMPSPLSVRVSETTVKLAPVPFGSPSSSSAAPALTTVPLPGGLPALPRARGFWMRRIPAATVVLVAEGYPGKTETGKQIFGLDEAAHVEDVKVFHAGTRWEDGKLYTAGGRVLNVTARGSTLAEALERAYFVAEMIEFEGKDYRRDIGRKGLLKQK